jgi:hypothetical protein
LRSPLGVSAGSRSHRSTRFHTVGRILARATGETFTNKKIQAEFDGFTGPVSEGQRKALHRLDELLTGVWTKLKWEDVAARRRRVLKPAIINAPGRIE